MRSLIFICTCFFLSFFIYGLIDAHKLDDRNMSIEEQVFRNIRFSFDSEALVSKFHLINGKDTLHEYLVTEYESDFASPYKYKIRRSFLPMKFDDFVQVIILTATGIPTFTKLNAAYSGSAKKKKAGAKLIGGVLSAIGGYSAGYSLGKKRVKYDEIASYLSDSENFAEMVSLYYNVHAAGVDSLLSNWANNEDESQRQSFQTFECLLQNQKVVIYNPDSTGKNFIRKISNYETQIYRLDSRSVARKYIELYYIIDLYITSTEVSYEMIEPPSDWKDCLGEYQEL